MAVCTLFDYQRIKEILENLKIDTADEELRRYKTNWLHITRMDNRMPRKSVKYRTNGRKRLGRPLKRLLDLRDRSIIAPLILGK
jgi:lipocalin